jgi:lysozyme family protein
MSLVDQIIDDVIRREGGYSNNPADRGGRTKYGITERDHPDLWADGDVTLDEARSRFYSRYVITPGFDKISDPHLMAQLVDFGVNSGPFIAIQKLQIVLGTKSDGVLGPKTIAALSHRDSREVGNLLVGERVKMLGRICVRDKSQITFLNGWLNRATEFLR